MTNNLLAGLKPLLNGVALLALFLMVAKSQAIIVRHDKNVKDYQVRESQFPAVFYIERQDNRKVCVATLIDSQWAITAAHCATITSLKESLDSEGRFLVSVTGKEQHIDLLVAHPDYSPGSANEVDLALVRFSRPIAVPRPIDLNTALNEAGRTVNLLGWGYFGVGTTGRQFSDGAFRMARNRIESAGRRIAIRFDDPRDIESEVLDLEGMPSLGDSGGPALIRQGDGWLLAGVAVGEVMDGDFEEETQGDYGSVAVYERVARHVDWIRHTIKDNSQVASD